MEKDEGPALTGLKEDDDWRSCETRRPWVSNSLKQRALDLRGAEQRLRRMFNKPYMGVPADRLADVYGEAASVFELELAALSQVSASERS